LFDRKPQAYALTTGLARLRLAVKRLNHGRVMSTSVLTRITE
jgi:hypothetical protein